jgi:hypothetical protein
MNYSTLIKSITGATVRLQGRAAMAEAHDELQGALAKLRRLKTGLMHDLLTGEVSVVPLPA